VIRRPEAAGGRSAVGGLLEAVGGLPEAAGVPAGWGSITPDVVSLAGGRDQ
jgi:hypothetical protein